jgi:DNA-binding transcriptional regulator YdaS (Cro superfamily)
MTDGLRQAIEVSGGVTAFCKRLGITRQSVWRWQEKGVPVERLEAIQKLTGVAPAAVRPDFARVMGAAPAPTP